MSANPETKNEVPKAFDVTCNVISYLLVVGCIFLAWTEKFGWSVACVAGILLFSNLPTLMNPSTKKSKLDKDLERELKRF